MTSQVLTILNSVPNFLFSLVKPEAARAQRQQLKGSFNRNLAQTIFQSVFNPYNTSDKKRQTLADLKDTIQFYANQRFGISKQDISHANRLIQLTESILDLDRDISLATSKTVLKKLKAQYETLKADLLRQAPEHTRDEVDSLFAEQEMNRLGLC